MAQHAILRFEKHKGNPARPLEAHHERQKEQYASNPDIDTAKRPLSKQSLPPDSVSAPMLPSGTRSTRKSRTSW